MFYFMIKLNYWRDVMEQKLHDLNSKIDFTLLDPRATSGDIERLCDVAYKNQYYSVCVNPSNVSYAKGYILKNLLNSLKVVSVVGFPLGANSIETKCFEIKEIISNGADEIDFVINIGKIKAGDFEYVKKELLKIRKASKGHILKCIVETCYLNDNELIKVSKLCSKFKIDFIKTSTGFGIGGADAEKVSIILREVVGRCKVKASGGIKTREQALMFLNLGVERIGTSHIL